MSFNIYRQQDAALYAKLGIAGTTYQISADFVRINIGDLSGKKILDHGCGAGRFSELLLHWGAGKVTGIDRAAPMISEAQAKNLPGAEFHVLDAQGNAPTPASQFDLAISAHVFCEAPNEMAMRSMAMEMHRLLKPGAVAYILTTNPDAFGHDFVSYSYAKPTTYHPGELVACTIHTDPPLQLMDVFWPLAVYRDVLRDCGFRLVRTEFPIAQSGQWKDETRIAPDMVLVVQKI